MTEIDPMISSFRKSQIFRLCLVGVLTLVLQIPIAMIGGLVSERKDRHQSAIDEVSSKWGAAQSITGPALVLPYVVRLPVPAGTGEQTVLTETRHAVFLPRRLQADGRTDIETRTRGIFAVPVYALTLSLQGEFTQPDLAQLGVDPATVEWDRAYVAIGISDVRAIREQSTLSMNESQSAFLPGTGVFLGGAPGVHAAVTADAAKSGFRFEFPLSLNGSLSVLLAPFAEETVLHMTSNSPYPNFQGNWLPTDRTVSAAGFDALWRVSYLGRDFPQSWVSGTEVRQTIDASRFGVELTDPVDQYRMAERSVKYAGLFILLTFASIWLIEVLAEVRVHPIQYLMVGAALCAFYLLELSLSEHVQFGVAYATASLSVILMVAAYGRVILRRDRHSAAVSTGVAALYGYLFVLLTNEDGALLIGSIGLFVILAAIMYLTRGVDWYGNDGKAKPQDYSHAP